MMTRGHDPILGQQNDFEMDGAAKNKGGNSPFIHGRSLLVDRLLVHTKKKLVFMA